MKKELILYLIFGILTTAISFIVYLTATRLLSLDEISATIISWVLSVAFAFITNKKYVFSADTEQPPSFAKQCSTFYASRLFTLGVETIGMWVLVTSLGFNDLIIKVLLTGFVIVLNYILSKLVVFKR